MNKKSYLYLLTCLLISCEESYQEKVSDNTNDVSSTEFNLEKRTMSSLSQVFKFNVPYNGDKPVLDNRVVRTRATGVCNDGTRSFSFEEEISSNRFPVGAVFPPEFLLKLYRTREVYDCKLVLYPLDGMGNTIQYISPETVEVQLQRDMSFGIGLLVGDRRPSLGYIIGDLQGARISVEPRPEFEDPREHIKLSFICDNGSEELLRREGIYSTDNTNVILGDDRLINVFTEDPFLLIAPARNMYIIKDWLGESNSNCIITNSTEGSPYLLWSHIINYYN